MFLFCDAAIVNVWWVGEIEEILGKILDIGKNQGTKI